MACLSETIWFAFAMQGHIALSFLNYKVHSLKHFLDSERAMKNTFLKLNLAYQDFFLTDSIVPVFHSSYVAFK